MIPTKRRVTLRGKIKDLEERCAHYEAEMLAARKEKDDLEVICMTYRAEIKRLRGA